MKFRTKEFVIEAVKWDGKNKAEIELFVGEHNYNYEPGTNRTPLQVLNVLEKQWMNCVVGCWIIKGMKGEFYPCDSEVFVAKYEPFSSE